MVQFHGLKKQLCSYVFSYLNTLCVHKNKICWVILVNYMTSSSTVKKKKILQFAFHRFSSCVEIYYLMWGIGASSLFSTHVYFCNIVTAVCEICLCMNEVNVD